MTARWKRPNCAAGRNRNESRTEFENTSRTLNQQWKQTVKEGYGTRGIRGQKVDEKGSRALETNERLSRAKLKQT